MSARPIPCIVLLMVCVDSLLALDRNFSTFQYLHTSWTQEEGGALPAIQTMAQTSDGYLWLGTSNGLIRFDGMRFVRWEAGSGEDLPSRDVRCLVSSTRGGLWIGTASGIARFDRGRSRPLSSRGSHAWRRDRHGGRSVRKPLDASVCGIPTPVWRSCGRTVRSGPMVRQMACRIRGWRRFFKIVPPISGSAHSVVSAAGLREPGRRVGNAFPPDSLRDWRRFGELLAIDGARSVVRFHDGRFEPVVTGLENASLSPRVMMRDRDGEHLDRCRRPGIVALARGPRGAAHTEGWAFE